MPGKNMSASSIVSTSIQSSISVSDRTTGLTFCAAVRLVQLLFVDDHDLVVLDKTILNQFSSASIVTVGEDTHRDVGSLDTAAGEAVLAATIGGGSVRTQSAFGLLGHTDVERNVTETVVQPVHIS